MIRVSEMVLPGHPDKFCDQVADAIIAAALAVDPEAYGQIEVACWSDQVWLSGGLCTRSPIGLDWRDVVVQTGLDIGYVPGNAIDANRYQVINTICERVGDPRRWSAHVNDQAIVIGWAGYDEGTAWLPPEHYLAHAFRDALTRSCQQGELAGEGPDGKLLVRIRENQEDWIIEHVLVTLQQREQTRLMDLCERILTTLAHAYRRLQHDDRRWTRAWSDIECLVNPNGPLLNGGSDGDNGQTGRKLVMDYYGPRVPIGGGALCGKHPTHIDRIGARAARDAALHAVQTGATECLVQVTYAPNLDQPLDVSYNMTGRGQRLPAEYFGHTAMRRHRPTDRLIPMLVDGRTVLQSSPPGSACGREHALELQRPRHDERG
ncbi:MAG: hypothetical protein EA370_01010 [Wenzhouxiangella sp.]|nr:MAG: hypothetical protein EA370_01010 [Wenzhouxiangella sp.]